MELIWYKSHSTTKPIELDTQSSPTTVYFRKNVVEIEIEDEEGKKYTEYEYDEAKLSKVDYAIYLGDVNTANIDFLAIMTGVDIDE